MYYILDMHCSDYICLITVTTESSFLWVFFGGEVGRKPVSNTYLFYSQIRKQLSNGYRSQAHGAQNGPLLPVKMIDESGLAAHLPSVTQVIYLVVGSPGGHGLLSPRQSVFHSSPMCCGRRPELLLCQRQIPAK